MRMLVLMLALVSVVPVARGQEGVIDTTARVPRSVSPAALDALRAEKAFVYRDAAEKVEGTSLWDALMRYLNSLLSVASSPVGRPLVYFLLGLLVLWGILKLLRIEPSAAFRRAAAQVRGTGGMPDDLSALDYRAEAQRARSRGDFRLAMRYLFLHVLQRLDEAGRIAYRPEKTNRAYLREMGALRADVEPFVYAFEVAWYGHVDPSPARFDELERAFARVDETLRHAR